MKKEVETKGLLSDTFHDGEKGVVHQRSVNHKPILDHNKKLFNLNDGYSPSRELKRVASIPTLVLEIWAKEYNGTNNWFQLPKDIQRKIMRTKLNSNEFRYFRTAEGNL